MTEEAKESKVRFLNTQPPAVDSRGRVIYGDIDTVGESRDENAADLPSRTEMLGRISVARRRAYDRVPILNVEIGPAPPLKGGPLNAGFPLEREDTLIVTPRIRTRE
jgi:hypothetical protein